MSAKSHLQPVSAINLSTAWRLSFQSRPKSRRIGWSSIGREPMEPQKGFAGEKWKILIQFNVGHVEVTMAQCRIEKRARELFDTGFFGTVERKS